MVHGMKILFRFISLPVMARITYNTQNEQNRKNRTKTEKLRVYVASKIGPRCISHALWIFNSQSMIGADIRGIRSIITWLCRNAGKIRRSNSYVNAIAAYNFH